MRRLHLFEIEDQPWCPAVLRDGGTAYLTTFSRLTGILGGAEPLLRKLLAASEDGRFVDLCSGAAGPTRLALKMVPEARAHCTDLFPNIGALELAARDEERLTFSAEPVDATAVPAELTGARTLFNAFHHFRPEQGRAILEDAVRSGQPIGIFEFVGRQPHAVPGMLGVPLAVAALVPFLRPFQWAWLPLTYLLPLLPMMVLWDGLVSCLRVYSTAELTELVEGLDGFEWEIGTFPLPFPGYGTYLLGFPK